jgi:hypothetical protein
VPAGRIETMLAEAEGAFVALMHETDSWDHDVAPDVQGVLTGLAACLDKTCAKEVADCVLHYLATHRPWL